ncbi:hypothetical protein SeLEV6574_g05593 [Synchytrium endobioticum]|uniref:Magnesium transporter n=1 Tax=Synchytrium endobioticum TaxID=286115 RepID=A0A507CTN7_9FUNG|nr:hypothetical protein SeLEV6574_g05593 [Synchytrium endobioticum]
MSRHSGIRNLGRLMVASDRRRTSSHIHQCLYACHGVFPRYLHTSRQEYAFNLHASRIVLQCQRHSSASANINPHHEVPQVDGRHNRPPISTSISIIHHRHQLPKAATSSLRSRDPQHLHIPTQCHTRNLSTSSPHAPALPVTPVNNSRDNDQIIDKDKDTATEENDAAPLSASAKIKIISAASQPDLKLRAMVFNSDGQIEEIDREYRKLDLCTEHGLLPRDLRTIDSSTPWGDHISSILVRRDAIVLHLRHIRCIIKADKVLLIGAPGADTKHQSAFVYELQGRLQSKETTCFEHRALEAVLHSIISGLEETKDSLLPPVERLLNSMAQHVNREKLLELLEYMRRINKFGNQVSSLGSTLKELLNNDDDLAESYLTETARGKSRAKSDHIEIEFLLEHYVARVEDLAFMIQEVSEGIESTQATTNMILASQRNQLLLFEIKVMLASMALACFTAVGTTFGMNIRNGLEDSPYFHTVVGGSIAFATLMYLGTVLRMRRMVSSGAFAKYTRQDKTLAFPRALPGESDNLCM